MCNNVVGIGIGLGSTSDTSKRGKVVITTELKEASGAESELRTQAWNTTDTLLHDMRSFRYYYYYKDHTIILYCNDDNKHYLEGGINTPIIGNSIRVSSYISTKKPQLQSSSLVTVWVILVLEVASFIHGPSLSQSDNKTETLKL